MIPNYWLVKEIAPQKKALRKRSIRVPSIGSVDVELELAWYNNAYTQYQ